jgi:molybdenum cofactor biosynthesis protein B
MGHKEHKHHAPKSVKCAIITVSDSRDEDSDTSGKAMIELLESSGHVPIYKGVVKDNPEDIKTVLNGVLKDSEIQAVIIDGGTGVAKRDITIEVLEPMLDKVLPGFGEMFRMLSYDEIGSAAIMSRATAGIIDGKIIFSIPGSLPACKLAVSKLIAPELGHLIWEVSK